MSIQCLQHNVRVNYNLTTRSRILYCIHELIDWLNDSYITSLLGKPMSNSSKVLLQKRPAYLLALTYSLG